MIRARFFVMWLIWTAEMHFINTAARLLLPDDHPSKTFILGRMKTAKIARDTALSHSAAACPARICHRS